MSTQPNSQAPSQPQGQFDEPCARKERWVQSDGLSALSAAVDEIFFLRALLADEASITEAHLDYKTFPKSRRGEAQAQVDRMRRAARGDLDGAAREGFVAKRALLQAEASQTLTNDQWARQRGLVDLATESTYANVDGEGGE